MINEIEKQFMETFSIPKIFKTTINIGDLDMNYQEIQAPTLGELYEEARYDVDTPIYFSWFKRSKRWSEEYPQITDRILLGLICILTKHYDYADQNWLTKCNDIKELKVGVLRLLLLCTSSTIEKYKHQVQELFKYNK